VFQGDAEKLIVEWRKIGDSSLYLKFKVPEARDKFLLNLLPSRLIEEQKQNELSLPLKPVYTFDTFKTTEGSKMAQLMCLAISEGLQKLQAPLVLVGPQGCGKTHLLQAAVARRKQKDREARAIYTTAETFTNAFIANRTRKDQFFSQLDDIDLLAVDDIHFLQNKPRSSEEFASFCRRIMDRKSDIILSSSAPLKEVRHNASPLSRLLTEAIICTIEPPLPSEKKEIIRLKAELLGLRFSEDSLESLVENSKSICEVEGELIRCSLTGKLHPPNAITLLLRQIREKLSSANIKQGLKIAPYILAFLLKKKGYDNAFIMRMLGFKSTSSIGYAVRRVEKLIESTILTSEIIEELSRYVDDYVK